MLHVLLSLPFLVHIFPYIDWATSVQKIKYLLFLSHFHGYRSKCSQTSIRPLLEKKSNQIFIAVEVSEPKKKQFSRQSDEYPEKGYYRDQGYYWTYSTYEYIYIMSGYLQYLLLIVLRELKK